MCQFKSIFNKFSVHNFVLWVERCSLPGEFSILDRFEPGYERVDCPVAPDLGQPTRAAVTYVYPGPICDTPPFDWYLDHLLEGARAYDLPATWQRKLEAVRAGSITSAEAEFSPPPPKRLPAARR